MTARVVAKLTVACHLAKWFLGQICTGSLTLLLAKTEEFRGEITTTKSAEEAFTLAKMASLRRGGRHRVR